MVSVFNDVFDIQLGISVSILLLLVLRRYFKEKYQIKLCWLLWLIIAVRLCFPLEVSHSQNNEKTVSIPVTDNVVYSFSQTQTNVQTDYTSEISSQPSQVQNNVKPNIQSGYTA